MGWWEELGVGKDSSPWEGREVEEAKPWEAGKVMRERLPHQRKWRRQSPRAAVVVAYVEVARPLGGSIPSASKFRLRPANGHSSPNLWYYVIC